MIYMHNDKSPFYFLIYKSQIQLLNYISQGFTKSEDLYNKIVKKKNTKNNKLTINEKYSSNNVI